MLSHVCHARPFATLWTMAHQAPLSVGFSRQEYWSELPYPPPGDLPDPIAIWEAQVAEDCVKEKEKRTGDKNNPMLFSNVKSIDGEK